MRLSRKKDPGKGMRRGGNGINRLRREWLRTTREVGVKGWLLVGRAELEEDAKRTRRRKWRWAVGRSSRMSCDGSTSEELSSPDLEALVDYIHAYRHMAALHLFCQLSL